VRLGRRWRWTAAIGALALGLGLTAYLATPRSSGLEGDWAAKGIDGTVVAQRALVGRGNTAVDLRTGTTITLGSVQGGTPFIGDDRLVIVKGNRLDSVRLDAKARWTWLAPAGASVTPVAAGGGSTVALVCTTPNACTLNGIGAQGRQEWTLPTDLTIGGARPTAALPGVLATSNGDDGIVLTDPVTGRQTVRAGTRPLTTPEGVVVVATRQQGSCVVSAYRDADPLWVRVLGPCPDGTLPTLTSDGAWVRATSSGTVTTLAADTGRTVQAPASRSLPGAVASSQGVGATRATRVVHTNPFRWGQRLSVVDVRDQASGAVRATLVSPKALDVLLLRPEAIVVREGDQVVRYTLASTLDHG
jgi:hypothetical protein